MHNDVYNVTEIYFLPNGEARFTIYRANYHVAIIAVVLCNRRVLERGQGMTFSCLAEFRPCGAELLFVAALDARN